MSPKKPEQNLDTDPPHLIYQYSSGNINTLHIYMHTYLNLSSNHIIKNFTNLYRQIIFYIAGETLLTSSDVKKEE